MKAIDVSVGQVLPPLLLICIYIICLITPPFPHYSLSPICPPSSQEEETKPQADSSQATRERLAAPVEIRGSSIRRGSRATSAAAVAPYPT